MFGRIAILFALWLLPAISPGFSGGESPEVASLGSQALREFYNGEHALAAENLRDLAGRRQDRAGELIAFLFERQDYAGAEQALLAALAAEGAAARPASERWLWLARCQANQAKWPQALESLQNWKGLETDPAALCLYAEAVASTGGAVEVAVRAWEKALAAAGSSRGAALTHYKAARFFQGQGLSQTAAALYRQAEKLDGNFTQVHEPLAQIYEAQQDYTAARSRLERAAGFDGQYDFYRQELARLENTYPGLKVQAELEQQAKEKARFEKPNARVTPVDAAEGTPMLRVGLITMAPSFKFRTGGPMQAYRLDGDEAEELNLRLEPDAIYDVSLRGRSWRLLRLYPEGTKNPKVELRFRHPVVFKPLDPGSTFALFDIAHGAGYYWASSVDRYYRGELELMPRGVEGVTVVNTVNMEEYLMGVVPAEIPPHWPAEALKAQAIAARTHAWTTRGRFREQGFDLCPTQQCAVYRGVSAEHAATNAAVLATQGKVLENPADSKLLPVFYMSNSGGHTQDPGDAWKWNPAVPSSSVFDGPEENPYSGLFPLRPDYLLQWLEDRGDWPVESYSRRPEKERPSNFRWTMQYDAGRLERFVLRRHKDIGRLMGIETMDRSRAGYVKQVRFVGEKGSSVGSSDYIRSAIKGLKSSMFYVETRRDAQGYPVEFLFHGGGWGHGVGLCQTGAAGMAEQSFKGDQILAHYFPGGIIRKRY
jgi:SpoIID/LytB domain protein